MEQLKKDIYDLVMEENQREEFYRLPHFDDRGFFFDNFYSMIYDSECFSRCKCENAQESLCELLSEYANELIKELIENN